MSKDVKTPSKPQGTVLPSQMQGTAATSVSRVRVSTEPGYINVSKTSDSKDSPTSTPTCSPRAKDSLDGLRTSDSTGVYKEGSGVCMGKSSLHPLLGQLGFSDDEVKQLLRQELIQERSGGRNESSLADWKHFYSVNTNTAPSTTEVSYSLGSIAGGTGVNQRTGATISLHRTRIKMRWERLLSGTPAAATRPPTYFIVIWRNKIPATPGTAPTIFGTDANPPASGTLMFSQLGSAAVESVGTHVLNPITQNNYHIYHVERLQIPTSVGYSYVSTSVGQPAPTVHYLEFDIHLHSVQQKYPSYGSTAADINNVWMTVVADTLLTNMGFADNFAHSIDTEFHDVQDAL